MTCSKITIIRGLPGSGKSFYGAHIAEADNSAYYDDPRALPLKETTDFILSNPIFCRDEIMTDLLDKIKNTYPDAVVEIISFENNPKQALINAQGRPDKKVDGFISYLSSSYHPTGTIVPVFKP